MPSSCLRFRLLRGERLDFPRTVFGLRRPPAGETLVPEAMARYAELFGRHRPDRIVEAQSA